MFCWVRSTPLQWLERWVHNQRSVNIVGSIHTCVLNCEFGNFVLNICSKAKSRTVRYREPKQLFVFSVGNKLDTELSSVSQESDQAF